jgi:F-type H+-transporting ATPase subunit b
VTTKRALLLLFLAAPVFASSEGEHACTATSTDEECHHYWEKHINWWSWDYKKPHEDPTHRHMPPPFGFALINFGIFAAIMWRLAGKPLLEYTRTRHLTIKKDLDEAAQLRGEAESRLKEYEAKIAGIDKEIADLLASIRAEAEAEKGRIIAAAADQAKRLKADAEAQIAQEMLRTRRELRREAVSAAVAAAEAVLRDKMSPDDQKRMAERYVAELEGPAPSSAARS